MKGYTVSEFGNSQSKIAFVFMPQEGEENLLRELKEIQSRIGSLIIDLEGERSERKDSVRSKPDKGKPNKKANSLTVGDKVIIGKPKKGQESIGTVKSIGKYFVSVQTSTGIVRRIPQNLKRVGS